MQNPQAGNSGAMNVTNLEDSALNLFAFFCSVITMPLEIGLRLRYGTRYFPAPVIAFSCLLMIVLPAASVLFSDLRSTIPFSHAAVPAGMFGLAALSKLFFAGLVIHGVRQKRLMIRMHLEQNSYFEGPALPFFNVIPWCRSSFWFTRLAAEPLFLVLVSIVLQDLFVIQPGVALYLRVAAAALAMKNYISWYRSWQYLRDVFDAESLMPVLTKLVEGRASEEELSTFHLASFPKDVPDEMRAEATANIVRTYSPKN